MKRTIRWLGLAVLICGIAACETSGSDGDAGAGGGGGGGGGGGSVSFSAQVLPILTNSCGSCHGGAGGLGLTSYSALMNGGVSGDAVVAGDPDNSLLIQRMDGSIPSIMPPSGALPNSQIDTIRQWIQEGALNN